MFDWLKNLFGGNNDAQAYKQLPSQVKDAVAYSAGVGAGIPGQPSTYATTAPIDNIVKKYVPTATAPAAAPVATATAAAAPSTANAQNDILSKINSINDIYGSIFGNLNRSAADKVSQITNAYDTQNKQLTNDYGQNALATANAFGARGLGDSSYFTNAKNSAADIFNTNLDKLNQSEQSNLASVGQTTASAKNGYQATKDQIAQYIPKLGSLTAADLASLGNQLDQIYRQATADNSGIGTTSDFLGKLAGIVPYQQTASDQLKTNLARVTGTNTTKGAQDTIANGLIRSSGQDPNAWMDYYKRLIAGA